MRSRAREGPPPLLLRLYGNENVVSLRQLLLGLSQQSPEASAALRSALVQPTDHEDYAQVRSLACFPVTLVCIQTCSLPLPRRQLLPGQALLERTWCVLRPDAPPLRDGFTLCSEHTQPQARRAGVAWKRWPICHQQHRHCINANACVQQAGSCHDPCRSWWGGPWSGC